MNRQSKRILLISLGSVFGGAEVYIERLAALMQDNAVLFGLAAHPELRRRLIKEGVQVIPFPHLPSWLRGLSFIIALCLLPFVIFMKRIDVVHVNGYAEAILVLPTRLLGCTALSTRHLTFRIDAGNPLEHMVRLGARFIYRHSVRFANYVICVSEAVGREARQIVTPGRVLVIPNWVPAIPPLSVRPLNTIRRILFVGRLSEHKGLQLLLAAARGLREVEIVVVGDGEFRSQLERLSDGMAVRFLGFQSDPTPYYRTADIFVNPSLGPEGMPFVSLEAMAYAVPCLLSDLPVHLEIAGRGQSALLFRKGDVQDLREKLELLLSRSEMRHHYGEAAHECALATHSPAAAQRAYLRVFGVTEEVLSNPS